MAGNINPTSWIRVPNGGTPELPSVYTAIREALQESADAAKNLQSQINSLKPTSTSSAAAGGLVGGAFGGGGGGGGGSGGGSVTSVGLDLSTEAAAVFGVTGSPVLTAGTITLGLDTQTANKVFAGPTTGMADEPTFRALVATDIPDISATYLTVATAASTYLTQSAAASTYLPLAGGTLTGRLNLPASVASPNGAKFNLGSGATPSSFADGDVWVTATGINVRVAGSSLRLFPYEGGQFDGTVTTKAGTASAAGFILASGTNLTTPAAGAVEYDGSNLYFTPSSTRKTVAFTDSNITGTAANVTGTVAIANGGTGLTGIGTANYVLGVNSGATALEYKNIAAGTGISITHVAGSITVTNTSPSSGGTVTSVTGTSPISVANGTTTPAISLGTVAIANGGTGLTTYTAGDLLYYSTGTALSKLAAVDKGILYGTASAPAYTAAADMAWDNTNKRLGIGKAAPATVLDIVHTVAGNAAVNMSNSSVDPAATARYILNNSATSGGLLIRSSAHATEASDLVLYSTANNIRFYTGGNNRMSVGSTGNVAIDTDTLFVDAANNRVGIGTTGPQQKLDVAGTLIVTGNSDMPASAGTNVRITGGYASPDLGRIFIGDGSGWKLHFSSRTASTNTDRVTFTDEGRVGIGVTSPGTLLHLGAGTATVAPFRLTSGINLTTATAGSMEFDGTNLYFTPASTRKTVAFTDSNITGTAANVTGTVATGNGGTGLTSIGSANQVLGVNSGATALEYKTVTAGTGISISHAAGSITITNTSPSSGGTVTSVTASSPLASSGGTTPDISLGTVGVANGGTGQTSFLAGQILYASATTTIAGLSVTAGGMLYGGATAPAYTATADLTWDNTNKRLGIGIASPAYLLDLAQTNTSASAAAILSRTILTRNPGAASTATADGINGQLILNGAANNMTARQSVAILTASHTGTGTITRIDGLTIGAFSKASMGTVTALSAIRAESPSVSMGTVTTAYGLYIDTQDSSASVTTGYGVYQAGTADVNYFAGKVGIGGNASTPTYHVDAINNANSATVIRVRNTDTGSAAESYFAASSSGGEAELVSLSSGFTVNGIYAPNSQVVSGTGSGGFSVGALNAAGVLRFYTGGAAAGNERMQITAAGNVTIDTNVLYVDAVNNRVGVNKTPTVALDVTGSAAISAALTLTTADLGYTTSGLQLRSSVPGASASTDYFFHRGADTTVMDRIVVHTPSTSAGMGFAHMTSGGVTRFFSDGNTGDFTIDTNTFFLSAASNRIGLGTTAPQVRLHVDGTAATLSTTLYNNTDSILAVQNGGTGARLVSSTNTPTTITSVPALVMITSRGTVDAASAVVNGDYLGRVVWQGLNSTPARHDSSEIRAAVDSTPGAGVPGRLEFWTAGAGVTVERMRITSGGVVILGSGEAGTTPTGNTFRAPAGLGTNITGGTLTITAGNGTGTGGSGSIVLQTAPVGASGATANTMTDRLTITRAGSVVIGNAALANTATDGFLYIPTIATAGAPTNAPTAQTGRVAIVFNTGDNKLYIYNAAWKSVTLA